jgi:Tfp pilus assembly pilus retraction ATPase PilT
MITSVRDMFYTLAALTEILLVERADALHLHPGEKLVVEITRNLTQLSGPPLEPRDIETLLRQVSSKEEFREFQSSRIVSCYHQVYGKQWFNILAFREQGQIRLEIRAVR